MAGRLVIVGHLAVKKNDKIEILNQAVLVACLCRVRQVWEIWQGGFTGEANFEVPRIDFPT